MIGCGIAVVFMALVWIKWGKHFSKEQKLMAEIITAAAVMGFVSGVSERQNPALLEGGKLIRNENGEGSYEQSLNLWLPGAEEAVEYQVEVPEQYLTKEEEQAYIAAASEELQRLFPGENESVNSIRQRVIISDEYQNGKVLAEWRFDNYKVMDFEGNVIAEELPHEGELVKASVELSCGTTCVMQEFYFRVFPEVLSEKELLLKEISELIKEQGERTGEIYLKLPEQLGEQKVKWTVERDTTPEQILVFGVIIAALIPGVVRARQQEAEKQKKSLLEMEYPDMVSKMALLLSSGMTIQGAFRKIALSYEKKRQKNLISIQPAYEEMLIACREMESGMGEQRAYERYGERCGVSHYRKFGNLLAQNLKKGNRGIVLLLEKEAENAFEERKANAKRYGEEAGTKLLLPMMIMLGIVMLILIVPAVFAFQI